MLQTYRKSSKLRLPLQYQICEIIEGEEREKAQTLNKFHFRIQNKI
jgi:hypothetical protein